MLKTPPQRSHAVEVVQFLRVLLRKISGKPLLIWDGAPIHRGQPIKDFLARGVAKRLHLERLPGYAPERNLVEGVWNSLKRVELGTVCCPALGALSVALRGAQERLRYLWADQAYTGALLEWITEQLRWTVEVVERSPRRGFVVTPDGQFQRVALPAVFEPLPRR